MTTRRIATIPPNVLYRLATLRSAERAPVTLTHEQACRLLPVYQELLRIIDWEIKLRIVRRHELHNSLGDCSAHPMKRCAVIRLLDPCDYDPDIAWPMDMEVTLVHELLHVSQWSDEHPRDSKAQLAEEQHVNATAEAIVALVRAVRGEPA